MERSLEGVVYFINDFRKEVVVSSGVYFLEYSALSEVVDWELLELFVGDAAGFINLIFGGTIDIVERSWVVGAGENEDGVNDGVSGWWCH